MLTYICPVPVIVHFHYGVPGKTNTDKANRPN